MEEVYRLVTTFKKAINMGGQKTRTDEPQEKESSHGFVLFVDEKNEQS